MKYAKCQNDNNNLQRSEFDTKIPACITLLQHYAIGPLSQDEELGVIERVEGPTPWISSIVVAPKPKSPGKVRLCVDMRRANTEVQRESHLTPMIKEIIGDLNGATVFNKLDLNQGYNQLELASKSRHIRAIYTSENKPRLIFARIDCPITTFSTHLGLMRHKRRNFGISS